MKKFPVIISKALFIFFVFFIMGSVGEAAARNNSLKKQEKKYVKVKIVELVDAVEIFFNQDTLRRGYTVQTPEDKVRLGITREAIKVEEGLNVNISPFIGEIADLDGETLLSDLYSINLESKNKIEIKIPLWLSLKPEVSTSAEFSVKRWNRAKKIWESLASSYNAKDGRVQALLNVPNGIIGIFEEEKTRFEGKASWYDWHGAAMNLVPLGSEILVTNPKTGAQVTTKVVSTGPYVDGRIIDLPRKIFAEIGNLWDGVIDVVVEIIKEK